MKRIVMRVTRLFFLVISIVGLSTILPLSAAAQQVSELEFRNQPIRDILLVLARASGETIIPDDSVDGTASYYFSAGGFDDALRTFAASYGLEVWREDGVYYVSRVFASADNEAGTVTVRATDVRIERIVRALSRAMGLTVLYDRLPNERLTINAESVAPLTALEMLVRRFPGYEVVTESDYFYIQEIRRDENNAGMVASRDSVTVENERYSVSAERARFYDLIDELFERAGREYSMLKRSDQVVERIEFSNREFEEILRLVLEQADADYDIVDGVYYILDVNRSEILKKFDSTEVVPLEYLSASSVPELFPAGLASGSLYRIDRTSNAVILSGSHEEIDPVRTFLERMDQPMQGRRYHRFDLTHLSVDDAINSLPSELRYSDPQAIPGASSFVMLLSEAQGSAVEEYLRLVDIAGSGVPINLRYIKTEDLLERLPPSVNESNIFATASPTRFFFQGSEQQRELFERELAIIDRPTPQVRYELLVLQMQDSDSRRWGIDLSLAEAEESASQAVTGSFTSLLNLSFDVLTTFGHMFALQLDWELSHQLANVVADTTLNGLSGEEISFQNTNTFRYRDLEYDEDTGEVASTGVTRELTSGLLLDINGWVSGDGMVTMEVSSTISRQGSTSSGDDNPPPTSERVVTTHVRTPSGTPVVIGGLIQEESSLVERRIPILGSIPLLGRLFRDSEETIEKTELAIYIVPYIEYTADQDRSMETVFEEFYRELVAE